MKLNKLFIFWLILSLLHNQLLFRIFYLFAIVYFLLFFYLSRVSSIYFAARGIVASKFLSNSRTKLVFFPRFLLLLIFALYSLIFLFSFLFVFLLSWLSNFWHALGFIVLAMFHFPRLGRNFHYFCFRQRYSGTQNLSFLLLTTAVLT